jgi:hypothetical protein
LIALFEGRFTGFSTELLPGFNALLKACGRLPDFLRCGGTVALSALDFAAYLGSSEILLAGLDLAMAPDGRSHASASVYDGLRLSASKLVPVRSSAGGTVLTTPQFAHYVALFDSYSPLLAARGIRLWNASSSGAALGSCEVMGEGGEERFAKTCKPFLRSNLTGVYNLGEGFAPACAKGILLELVEELRAKEVQAFRALELNKRLFAAEEGAGALLAEIDRLDASLNSPGLAKGLCDDALKALSLGIPARAQLAGGTLSKEEAASLGNAFYEALAKASGYLAGRLASLAAGLPSTEC